MTRGTVRVLRLLPVRHEGWRRRLYLSQSGFGVQAERLTTVNEYTPMRTCRKMKSGKIPNYFCESGIPRGFALNLRASLRVIR